MPTGYTDRLYKGEQSLRDFIMEFTEASPDENQNQEIEHEKKKIEDAETHIRMFESMDDESILKYQKSKIDEENEKQQKSIKHSDELFARYRTMLTKVHNWNPPNGEFNYTPLKERIISQLNESIRYDTICRDASLFRECVFKNATTYRNDEIAYYKGIIRESSDRIEQLEKTKKTKIAWLKTLEDSLTD